MEKLEAHKQRMREQADELVDLPAAGGWRAPAPTSARRCYEIENASVLKEEVFGPILHVVRFQGGHLDRVIDAINASGYGPDAGPAQPHRQRRRLRGRAGPRRQPLRQPQPDRRRGRRAAVRRRGPSGTGPKAGGPNYLARFATERVRTTDVTATGAMCGCWSWAEEV